MVQGFPWSVNSYSTGQQIVCVYGIQGLADISQNPVIIIYRKPNVSR
jgi:hypothetical protein